MKKKNLMDFAKVDRNTEEKLKNNKILVDMAMAEVSDALTERTNNLDGKVDDMSKKVAQCDPAYKIMAAVDEKYEDKVRQAHFKLEDLRKYLD